jgi:hypothetical protein
MADKLELARLYWVPASIGGVLGGLLPEGKA